MDVHLLAARALRQKGLSFAEIGIEFGTTADAIKRFMMPELYGSLNSIGASNGNSIKQFFKRQRQNSKAA